VLSRWRQATPSRNLARDSRPADIQSEYRPNPPGHCQRRRTRQARSGLTANGNGTSPARDPQGRRRDVVVFLRLAGRNLVEGAAARFIPGTCTGRYIQASTPVFLLVIVSVIIKVVAGGKRRAERIATEATRRAETEQLERSVLEARMEALQAQIEPHFLFNTLASIDQLIQTVPPRASKMQQSLIRCLRSAMPQ